MKSALLGAGHKVSASHGRVVKRARQKYLISYHPAAALRNKNVRTQFLADLKKLKQYSRGV